MVNKYQWSLQFVKNDHDKESDDADVIRPNYIGCVRVKSAVCENGDLFVDTSQRSKAGAEYLIPTTVILVKDVKDVKDLVINN